MGWFFDLRYANIVSYLTHPGMTEPPRLTDIQLAMFLGSITNQYRDPPNLISSSPHWVETIRHTAEYASRRVHAVQVSDEDRFLDPSAVVEILSGLRDALGGYDLYAIPVGTEVDRDRLNAFATHMAYSSLSSALILIPDYPSPFDAIDILDPTPPVRSLAERPENWPGVLFWLQTGESAFAPLRDAERLFHQFRELMDCGAASLAPVINDYNNFQTGGRQPRLLHLSDPHFGTPAALDNELFS